MPVPHERGAEALAPAKCVTRRRKFWGWGYEDGGPSEEQAQGIAANARAALRRRARSRAGAARGADRAARAARRAACRARGDLHGGSARARRPHLRQVLPRHRARAAPRLPRRARPRRVPARRGRGRRGARLVRAARASRRSRTAAARAWSAASRRAISRTLRAAWSRSTSARSTACSRSTAPRAPRASRRGVLGPALEDQLRPHGLTLRHFPQSFEFSTLGGWIATRSGGHYATLYTHIDEFVESLRVVTPTGVVATRRLPGSGAGPAPDRLFIGSEGSARRHHRGVDAPPGSPALPRVGAPCASRARAASRARRAAVRALAQSGLHPANCRLLDAGRGGELAAPARRRRGAACSASSRPTTRSTPGWRARSSSASRRRRRRARRRCADAAATRAPREGAAGAWRNAFLNAPYLRDVLARAGVVSETFETAVHLGPLRRLPRRRRRARRATRVQRVCGGGTLTCRFTHVYPDGPAPYYTVLAPGRAAPSSSSGTRSRRPRARR